jgi:hypothetical protein
MEESLKTPEYTRRAIKTYQSKNPEKNREYALAYYYRVKDEPEFQRKKKAREALRRIKISEMKQNSKGSLGNNCCYINKPVEPVEPLSALKSESP